MSRRKDDSQLAGTARTPQSASGLGRSELENLAKVNNWKVRDLNKTDIQAMSSAEFAWFEAIHPELLEAAFERDSNIKHNEEAMKGWDVRKKWSGQIAATDDDRQKMKVVAEQFERMYPQWIKSESNASEVWNFMRQNNLDPTQIASVIAAFESLAQSGKISLNPSAIGAGQETSVTGSELTSHRNFHRLLQSQRRPTVDEAKSADAWLQEHPELKPSVLPPIVAARREKVASTIAYFENAKQATNEGSVVRMTDYPVPDHRGAPAQPDKASFRKKIASMTAEQLKNECAIDPNFRKALDELK